MRRFSLGTNERSDSRSKGGSTTKRTQISTEPRLTRSEDCARFSPRDLWAQGGAQTESLWREFLQITRSTKMVRADQGRLMGEEGIAVVFDSSLSPQGMELEHMILSLRARPLFGLSRLLDRGQMRTSLWHQTRRIRRQGGTASERRKGAVHVPRPAPFSVPVPNGARSHFSPAHGHRAAGVGRTAQVTPPAWDWAERGQSANARRLLGRSIRPRTSLDPRFYTHSSCRASPAKTAPQETGGP